MLRKLDSGLLIVLCIVAVAFVYQTDELIRTDKYFQAATSSYDLSNSGNYEKEESDLTARVTVIATR